MFLLFLIAAAFYDRSGLIKDRTRTETFFDRNMGAGRWSGKSTGNGHRLVAVRMILQFAAHVKSAHCFNGISRPVSPKASHHRSCFESDGAYPPHMIQTIEAIVDERGVVRLLEPVQLDRRHRALVTILADEPSDAHETALLSEASLAKDWSRPEEDAAWAHLQQVQ